MAKELLIAVAEAPDGDILVVESGAEGFSAIAGALQKGGTGDAKESASAYAAVEQLARRGLIRAISEAMYKVSHSGFEKAEQLTSDRHREHVRRGTSV